MARLVAEHALGPQVPMARAVASASVNGMTRRLPLLGLSTMPFQTACSTVRIRRRRSTSHQRSPIISPRRSTSRSEIPFASAVGRTASIAATIERSTILAVSSSTRRARHRQRPFAVSV
jgi:hypothetical protein